MAKQRATVNDLGVIGLRPAASPVDQFAAPEVRREDNASGLLQLAGALRDITPAIGGILERRFQADVQKKQMQAVADAEKFRFENQKALKEAVARGELPESSNPWYMVQLRQSVARHEGRKAKEAAWAAYQNSDIQFSDDPTAVEAFLNEQLGPLMEGRDVWEAEALIPELQQARDSITSYHVNKRAKEREVERAIGFQSDANAALANVSPDAFANFEAGDATSTAEIQQAVDALQAQINEAGKTTHWATVNKWATESVMEQALVLTMREDTGKSPIVRQRIEFTDFPLKLITLYVENGVLLLPSEH